MKCVAKILKEWGESYCGDNAEFIFMGKSLCKWHFEHQSGLEEDDELNKEGDKE